MADDRTDPREDLGSGLRWGWILIGILLLGVLSWIIYSFYGVAAGPDPVPVNPDAPALLEDSR